MYVAPNGLTVIKFISTLPPYMAGVIAGFSSDVAETFIAEKHARHLTEDEAEVEDRKLEDARQRMLYGEENAPALRLPQVETGGPVVHVPPRPVRDPAHTAATLAPAGAITLTSDRFRPGALADALANLSDEELEQIAESRRNRRVAADMAQADQGGNPGEAADNAVETATGLTAEQRGAVVIPENWETAHNSRQKAVARELGAVDPDTDVAKATIREELNRRAAAEAAAGGGGDGGGSPAS